VIINPLGGGSLVPKGGLGTRLGWGLSYLRPRKVEEDGILSSS